MMQDKFEDEFRKSKIVEETASYRVAVMNQKDLDSSCWSVQFWGIGYCKACEYRGTDDCGGRHEIKNRLRELYG